MTALSSSISMNQKHPVYSGVLSGWRKIWIGLFFLGLILLAVYFYNTRSQIPARIVSSPLNQVQPAPVGIKIPAINVDASISKLGLNEDGTLAVPAKGDEVGWYVGSSSPGGIGASVLVGHLDWAFRKGVFWDLKKLKPGDEIEINRQDGSTSVYKVVEQEIYSQDQFPTEKVYGKTDHAALRLITCSGDYSLLRGRYSDNLIVYASLSRVFTN